LLKTLPKLSAIGVNAVIVEVNYRFEFRSHPELRERDFITVTRARELATAARQNGIRLIPLFNCMGHQSHGRRPVSLLRKHPEFNETPGLSANASNVYCLSWCPRAPGLQEIVASLVGEIADAFEADAIHVGMDEVYFIGSEGCARCKGTAPSKLFSEQVESLHKEIIKKRGLEMLMWGDRVIGPKYQGYSKYDNAQNYTGDSIELVPKDIIICDWHYEKRTNYTSLPLLTNKGFRVWPAGFLPIEASQAFANFSHNQKNERVIGYLCTTWNMVKIAEVAEWPPVTEVLKTWKTP